MRDFVALENNIRSLMTHLTFPEDAQEEFICALQKIAGHPEHAATLHKIIHCYEETENCDYLQMLTDMTILCSALSIHPYTGNALLCLCMGPKLLQRYEERNLDHQIFYASMMDLRYKLEECRLVHGINGTFVPRWYRGFFNLTRFALGRLQFEIVLTKSDYTVDGVFLPQGSKAINIHIPRTGTRLDRQDVLDAYRQAACFFREDFPEGPAVFTCHSWMLYPWLRTILAPNSNISAFYDDFTIVEWENDKDYSQIWRFFDCAYTGDPDKLPQKSSLHRSVVQRIKDGLPIGMGRGFFLLET